LAAELKLHQGIDLCRVPGGDRHVGRGPIDRIDDFEPRRLGDVGISAVARAERRRFAVISIADCVIQPVRSQQRRATVVAAVVDGRRIGQPSVLVSSRALQGCRSRDAKNSERPEVLQYNMGFSRCVGLEPPVQSQNSSSDLITGTVLTRRRQEVDSNRRSLCEEPVSSQKGNSRRRRAGQSRKTLALSRGDREMLSGGRRGMATSSLHVTIACHDVPAERPEQVPRRPGPE
jgi:hypothetical protein